MNTLEERRFVAKVARMYHILGFNQTRIARQLDISQATVSRLLKRAEAERIVRVSVHMPDGVHNDLEEQLEALYELKRAIVVDHFIEDDPRLLLKSLGSAAAYYLESTLSPQEVIGLASWSATLLAMTEAVHHGPGSHSIKVVQLLGSISSPPADIQSGRLTERLAKALNAQAIYLPAPGVTHSKNSHQILMQDPCINQTMSLFDQVTLAFVGIGALETYKLPGSSAIFSSQDIELLKAQGAVGNICLNFFDAQGQPVEAHPEKSIIGIRLDQLARIQRSVGVAGGWRKYAAIRAALTGRYINVLITDQITAARLIEDFA